MVLLIKSTEDIIIISLILREYKLMDETRLITEHKQAYTNPY